MKIQHHQFQVNEAWIICRLHTLDTVAGKPMDVYMLLDAASSYIFGHLVVLEEVPSAQETQALFKTAYESKRQWPTKLIATKIDPALEVFQAQADAAGFPLEKAARRKRCGGWTRPRPVSVRPPSYCAATQSFTVASRMTSSTCTCGGA